MTRKIEHLPTSDITPGDNDRTDFDPTALTELANSIADHGLLQPITVRRVDDVLTGDPLFQIVALHDDPLIRASVHGDDLFDAHRFHLLSGLVTRD